MRCIYLLVTTRGTFSQLNLRLGHLDHVQLAVRAVLYTTMPTAKHQLLQKGALVTNVVHRLDAFSFSLLQEEPFVNLHSGLGTWIVYN